MGGMLRTVRQETVAGAFVDAIRANLQYWLERAADVSDESLIFLDRDRSNLLRAVEFGLRLDTTAVEAAVLVDRLFPLIERRGYWEEWTPILQQAIFSAQLQPALWLRLQNQLGFLFRLKRQLQEAATIHAQVAEEAERLGEKLELAEAHFRLGNVYLESHEYARAHRHAETALDLFEALNLAGGSRKVAAVQNLLGQIAQAQGHYAMAEAMFRQAATGWRHAGDRTYLARTLINLGRTLTAAGAFSQALTELDSAAAILKHTVSELDKTSAHLSRGVVFYRLEDWPQAEEAFRLANSSFLQQSGNYYLQAYVYNNLGHVLLKQGKSADAVALLRESARLWRQVEDGLMLGNTLGVLAGVLVTQSEVAEALSIYQEAFQLLESFPENAWARERLAEYRSQREAIPEEG
jgi:tetratricopeptide (TPR) repeat protein